MFGKWLLSLLLPATLAIGLALQRKRRHDAAGRRQHVGVGQLCGESGRVVHSRSACAAAIPAPAPAPSLGGGLGAAGGAAIGAAATHSVVGAVVGGLLGAVGGAIAGTAIDSSGSTRRGIEVTVQKDNGQKVAIAQSDDGDVQMGDRVTIVTDRNGVARAVRDTGGFGATPSDSLQKVKAVLDLDVKGFAQGPQACFVEGLAQGRMGVDGAADIFQPRAHFEREAEGGGEFRHPAPTAARPRSR